MDSYTPTAYRADAVPEQPPTDETVGGKGWRFNWRRGQRLAPGNYRNIPPKKFLDSWSPSRLREIEHKYQQPGAPERPAELWDHERMHMMAIGRLLHVLGILKGAGTVGAFMFVPISVLVAVFLGYKVDNQLFGDAFFELLNAFFLYLIIPCLLAYLPLTLIDWINNRFGTSYGYHFHSLYELNRRTGQVTLYNRFSKPTFSAPFYEFDAYVNGTPDRQGFVYYQLSLVHKYQPQAFVVENLVSADQHGSECLALWDYLQGYMDVTQPLPDIPLLEECRVQDPTSVAYDQKTNRPADYWLRMADKDWKKYLAAMAKQRKAAFG
ncbi:MAG: hypothetical protein ACJAWL_003584 [Motiliproteus sp.]|jgi:hypothetical protein